MLQVETSKGVYHARFEHLMNPWVQDVEVFEALAHRRVPELLNIRAITVCLLLPGEGATDPVVTVGAGFCAFEDAFSRKTGRLHALESALRNSGFSRPDRTKFWAAALSN